MPKHVSTRGSVYALQIYAGPLAFGDVTSADLEITTTNVLLDTSEWPSLPSAKGTGRESGEGQVLHRQRSDLG